MTKTKTTKRALIASVLSLLVCFSMLIGSTFAWFTDTATTGVNNIQAGTLDVVLEVSYNNGETWQDANGETLDFIKAEDGKDEEILWEPGCTYELPLLRVRNEGNLWLKYQLAITGIKGDAKLNEAIEWSNGTDELNLTALNTWTNLAPKGTTEGDPTDTSATIKIVGHMKEEAGNEYQGLSIEGIGITVFATQLNKENDSFGSDYDKDAPTLFMIGETRYETLAAAIAAAKDGETIAFSGVITLPTDDSLKNRTLTFAAIDESVSVIDMKNVATGQSTSGAKLTFKGVDVIFDNTANYKGIQHAAEITYEDCTLYGKQFMYAPTVAFTNCEFVNYADYAVWTYGASAATFTNCTFTTGGKAVLVYADGGKVDATHTFTNCTFNSNGQLATDKAAVEVGAGCDSTYTLNFTNCTANGFAANKSTSPLWGNKNNMTADELKVTVDGNSMNTTAPTVKDITTAKELKEVLAAGTQADAGNYVVNIEANINLTGDTWTPYTVDGYNGADVITINGNGHTITGLSAPLFAGGFAGGSGIVINDLTIKDSTIVSTNTQGSGAFIECVDSMAVITLNNCHLLNSTVNGSRTGGLIGWTSGYNNTNDGAVKTYVTVENCSVIGCTIENTFSDSGSTPHTESVGAIFGHAGANPWTFTTIKNCTIKNNTILGGNGKTGVILGTANVGEVTITGCTMENNTVNGSKSDSVYGRTAFGTTGKLTIDGVAVQ